MFRRLSVLVILGAASLGCDSGAPPSSQEHTSSTETSLRDETPLATAETATPEAPHDDAVAQPLPDLPKRSGIYATWQSLPLTRKRNGFDGALRLLEDSRVTRHGALRHGTVYLTEPTLLFARLELVADDGRIVEARELQRPIADLVVHDLHGDGRPTYFLTVDFTCGMGSYCGPITTLHEVASAHIHDVESVDDKTNRFTPIQLLTSLKTDWKLVPAASGKGQDILHIASRPSPGVWAILLGKHEGPVEFVTARSRFSFEKAAWVHRYQQTKEYHDVAFHEFEDTRGFPPG